MLRKSTNKHLVALYAYYLLFCAYKAHILHDHILHPQSYPIPKRNNYFTNYY